MEKQMPIPNSFILTNVPVESLLEPFKDIVRSELEAHFLKNEVEEQLLSREEARKIFKPNVSKVTMIKWERLGLLQSCRIGGRIYYKRSEVISSAQQIPRYRLGPYHSPDNSKTVNEEDSTLLKSKKGGRHV